MPATAAETKKYSLREYLEIETRTGERYNYYDGVIKPMANNTIPHNRLSKNLLVALEIALMDNNNFEVFGGEQKIYLPHYNFYVYPDAVVVSAPPVISDEESNAIINPVLIIEILSKSTQKYDRGQKFVEYRSLPTFLEYCLVDQNKPEALLFYREKPGLWAEKEVQGLDADLHFRSVNVTIPMKQIYRRVNLEKI